MAGGGLAGASCTWRCCLCVFAVQCPCQALNTAHCSWKQPPYNFPICKCSCKYSRHGRGCGMVFLLLLRTESRLYNHSSVFASSG
jgi:hypothetical protein